MAEANTTAPAKKEPRKVPELQLNRLTETEFVHRRWTLTVPHGTQPEDLKGESYWAHCAHMLRRHDEIECIWEDGWGEARVRVLAVGHAWVKVHLDDRDVRKYPEFDQKTRTPGYRVEYVNNFARWSVIRESDKKVLKDQCDAEGDAHIWLASHLKGLAT